MSHGLGLRWASAVVVGSITGIALTADRLPLQVASHFGPNGLANGFMTRDSYLALSIAMVVMPPALVGLAITLAVRHFPRYLNLPNRDFWLAPERREATAAYLAVHAGWLAALLSVFALAIHLLVVRANQLAPPQLETAPFLLAMLVFGVMMVAWIGALARRFRRV